MNLDMTYLGRMKIMKIHIKIFNKSPGVAEIGHSAKLQKKVVVFFFAFLLISIEVLIVLICFTFVICLFFLYFLHFWLIYIEVLVLLVCFTFVSCLFHILYIPKQNICMCNISKQKNKMSNKKELKLNKKNNKNWFLYNFVNIYVWINKIVFPLNK